MDFTAEDFLRALSVPRFIYDGGLRVPGGIDVRSVNFAEMSGLNASTETF